MRSVNVTVRARLVDQGERARPPWEGRRHDPMPPSSPGETSAGQLTLSEAAEPVGGEVEARPRPKRRHQKRLQRPSHDARQRWRPSTRSRRCGAAK